MTPRRIALILPIIVFVSMSFKCGSSSAGSVQRKAAKASSDLAVTINEMIVKKRNLAQAGKITSEEELDLTKSC